MAAVQNSIAILTGAVGAYFLREWFKGGVCKSKARMDGKTVVITGCNTGIGKETALDLSRRGARVIMACRNLKLATAAADDIKKETDGSVEVMRLDLADLESVRECAQTIVDQEDRVDVLINNAGVMMCPYLKTKDGFEMQIGTNHLGHFLFTNLLLDKLRSSAPSRIVTVSSMAHERGDINLEDINWEKRSYNAMKAYGDSKLANIWFTRALTKRLGSDSGVHTYVLHPGVVRTELGRHLPIPSLLQPIVYALFWPFTKSPSEGAQTSIYCAVAEEAADQTGLYYSDCAVKEPTQLAKNEEKAEEFWGISEKMVKL